MKTAVIIPWRVGETELHTTIESAKTSLGRTRADIIPVEDTTQAGPAITRHRGIEAATDADVIILVDAHMLFDRYLLRDMARLARKEGGLYCPKCYHNPECSFDSTHPSGASYYTGADIHYKGTDQNGKQALVWKWSADAKPGPRACIGGACYVFRRDWYYSVGQPLSALPGWGGDEEALSISAWLSGHSPMVYDGRAAHRWRPKAPWRLTSREVQAIRIGSRAAIIRACVHDDKDANELLAWQGCSSANSPEIERWRLSLLSQSRTWAQWKASVPVMVPQVERPRKITKTTKGAYECTHCHCKSDEPKVVNVYKANARVICPECNRPFIVFGGLTSVPK